MHKVYFATASLFLLTACVEPRCPRVLIQRGHVCKHCPEGSEKRGNDCFTLDGGVIVEPVGAEEGGPSSHEGLDEGDVGDASNDSGEDASFSSSNTSGQDASHAGDRSSPQLDTDSSLPQVSNASVMDASAADSAVSSVDAGMEVPDSGPPYTGLPQQSYLKSFDSRSNDQFGSAIALADGKLVVGAPGEDDPASGTSDVGNAYVFVQISGQWLNQGLVARYSSSAPRAHLGRSVAVSGAWVAAGGDRGVILSLCVDGGNLTLACGPRATVGPPTGTFEDTMDTSFGVSVALSNLTLVVGAPTYDQRGGDGARTVGAAFLFSLKDQTWQQAYRFYGESGVNAVRGMEYGAQVATSGTTTVIGAPADWRDATGGLNPNADLSNSGVVFVYSGSDASWAVQDRIKASNFGAGDRFGAAVALYQDTLVVGAPGEASSGATQTDNSAPNAGAVYVFLRSGTMWTQHAYIKAPTPHAGDRFGASVAVYGDSIAVGAPGYNSAAGRVFVLRRMGAGWFTQTYVEAHATEGNDALGTSVAISETHVMVGAPGESSDAQGNYVTEYDEANNGASRSGAAYAFKRTP
jgi:hypothetical protein